MIVPSAVQTEQYKAVFLKESDFNCGGCQAGGLKFWSC